jgi:hypothetical protein
VLEEKEEEEEENSKILRDNFSLPQIKMQMRIQMKNFRCQNKKSVFTSQMSYD